jgi:hypothetical protein
VHWRRVQQSHPKLRINMPTSVTSTAR